MRIGPAIALSVALLSGCKPIADPDDLVQLRFVDVHGLSGLVVSADGASFTAISDRNTFVTGDLLRDSGQLIGVRVTGDARLHDIKGRDLAGPWNDAEGLDIGTDGSLYVSFEGQHRVLRFGSDLNGARLPDLPPLPDIKRNNGFEALALDPQDRPVIIMEKRRKVDDRTYILRLDGGDWARLADLMLTDGYLPVGADFGPDGRLYVLERAVTWMGFRSRIRQLDLTAPGPLDGPILWVSDRSYGNLEGLSLWTDDQGRVRATMVADDNETPALFGGFVEITLAKHRAVL